MPFLSYFFLYTLTNAVELVVGLRSGMPLPRGGQIDGNPEPVIGRGGYQ